MIDSNAAAMSSAIEHLRMVVGVDPTDEELTSLLLAADMDVNRAVNYFFGVEES